MSRIKHDELTVTVHSSEPLKPHPSGPHKPPVVLLPGLFGGGWIWDNVTGVLTARGHIVASIEEPLGRHPHSTDLAALADSLDRLIDRVGMTSPVLCGNSLGALLALEYAARKPEVLSGIVLIGAPGLGEELQAQDWGGLRTPSKEVGHTIAGNLFHDQRYVTPELVDRCFNDVSDSRTLLRIMKVLRMTRGYDATGLFRRVTCPALLLWGACDAVSSPDKWRNAVAHFPDARFEAVPRAGHSPMIEQPDVFNARLREFLDRLPDVPAESGPAPAAGAARAAAPTARS